MCVDKHLKDVALGPEEGLIIMQSAYTDLYL